MPAGGGAQWEVETKYTEHNKRMHGAALAPTPPRRAEVRGYPLYGTFVTVPWLTKYHIYVSNKRAISII